jgi:hypothetical protein
MSAHPENDRFEPLIGEWSLAMVPVGEEPPDPLPDVGARASFAWMGDGAFVVQRWTVPVPEAPNGLAVIGWNAGRGACLQHYFDDRGVARVYEIDLADGVWTMARTQPDLMPLDFGQRFTGILSADRNRIDGTWEIAHQGQDWHKDFDLIYTRVG